MTTRISGGASRHSAVVSHTSPDRSQEARWRTSRPTSRARCGRSSARSATQVAEGDTVVILESMKMEMPVEAEDAGTVKEILCEEGQAVNEGDTLVVLGVASLRPRGGRAAHRRAGGRRPPADDLQPRQAQRARPRDPRRDRRGGRGATARRRRCLLLTGADGMFSSGYDLGDIPDDVFADRGRAARRPPVRRRRSRRSTPPTCRRSPRCPATRSAAGSSWRWPATCASPPTASGSGCRRPSSGSSTRTPACGASSTRSARRARASCSCSGATIDARTALGWGLVNEVALPADLDEAALGMAEELAANAPLSVRGNKRVLRELLRAGGALDPDVERELIELRAPASPPRTCARACAPSARSAPPAGAGADATQARPQ